MDKDFIIKEIQRTAVDGTALGKRKFATVTSVVEGDWYGIHWARWSGAVKEAGLTPNELRVAYGEDYLLEKFVSLTREIRKYPSQGDLRLKATQDKDFPCDSTFQRLGSKATLVKMLMDYCAKNDDYSDVIGIFESFVLKNETTKDLDTEAEYGFVYLMKSGPHYTIGKSNHTGRRNYEHERKLPEKTKTIHTIKTDDPFGVESYWEKRFEDKKTETKGGWYKLNAVDVKSFKRWKRIF
ncbi:MAG: GIY-YIG nuclease family protein [Proteobacteria bacterium]|nr:GIY-YIG nuclease family protein [Pseudomonadota bacterium]